MPKLKAQDTVREWELQQIQAMRDDVRQLNEQLTKAKGLLDVAEENIMGRLDRGVRIIGRLVAVVAHGFGARRPRWKEEALALAAKLGFVPAAFELEVLERAPRGETKELVISIAAEKARAAR